VIVLSPQGELCKIKYFLISACNSIIRYDMIHCSQINRGVGNGNYTVNLYSGQKPECILHG
jgi:hypothetical protein